MSKLQDFLNTPLSNICKMGRGPKQGDLFGVELECEGRKVDWDGTDPDILKGWAPHADGSLRNTHGQSCEWVFNGPASLKVSLARITQLFDYFNTRGARLVCSNRTSTHIHFNMGDKSVYQLVNLFILFTILEDIMDRFCGEDRKGNLFCLSSRHAEEQVRRMEEACFQHQNFHHFREDFRYCSLNVASINKFGTVEFRAMRGLDNEQDMVDWLNIVNEFCQYACYTMQNPVNLVESISVKTPVGFIKEVFSAKSANLLLKGLSEHEINASVFDGLRLVQMLCYKIGTEFDQVRLRGRDFWASLGGDPEPVLDVDPEDVRPAGGARRGAQVRAGRPVPPPAPPVGGAGREALVQRELERARARLIQQQQMLGNPADPFAANPFGNPIWRNEGNGNGR